MRIRAGGGADRTPSRAPPRADTHQTPDATGRYAFVVAFLARCAMQVIPKADFVLPVAPGAASPPAITCHASLFEKRLLFVGLATGGIAVFRRRFDSQGVEQADGKPLVLDGHVGLVRCLLVHRAEGIGQQNYLLFSGSADRTVRIWDPATGGREGEKQCVQTLRGHGGTVTSIAYCDGVLVTASTDMSIRVWMRDEGRELLLYPWFSPHHSLGDLECWVNDVALTMGETGALYVGDEQGGISAYLVHRTAPTASLSLKPWRQRPKAHSLGIEKLMLVESESLLITSGYDNATRLWDSQSGAPLLTIVNEHKCRHTALAWDHSSSELILGDDLVRRSRLRSAVAFPAPTPLPPPPAPAACVGTRSRSPRRRQGYLYFWNIATERCVKSARPRGEGKRSQVSVRTISMMAGELIVSSPAACGAWLVVRDVKYSETKGHEGAIICLGVSEASSARQRGVGGGDAAGALAATARGGGHAGSGSGDTSLIYSASLDNTIRAYDPYDMTTLSVLHEQARRCSLAPRPAHCHISQPSASPRPPMGATALCSCCLPAFALTGRLHAPSVVRSNRRSRACTYPR